MNREGRRLCGGVVLGLSLVWAAVTSTTMGVLTPWKLASAMHHGLVIGACDQIQGTDGEDTKKSGWSSRVSYLQPWHSGGLVFGNHQSVQQSSSCP